MFQHVLNFWTSRAIHAAVTLGVPDHLGQGPRSAAELAALTGADHRSLYRLLRALASLDIVTLDEDGRFGSTPLSDTLRSDVPGSLAAFVTMELGDSHYRAWGELAHSLQTGEPAFDKAMGMSIWSYFAGDPEQGQLLDRAMAGMTGAVVAAVLDAYDFSPYRRLVDVGGGQGGLLAAILAAHPHATGVLFDRPDVIERARRPMTDAGLAGRCELVGGDAFDGVPPGGDLYLLKWVIHDWNDDASLSILRACRRVLPETGRVLVIDTVLPPGAERSPAMFIDLNMMVLGGGQERTAEEFATVLARAGLQVNRIIPTNSPSCIVEASAAR
jgi:precorrin-6B methylase 2